MTTEQIAERLHARRSGAGWIARCPAHEDRLPSLSIGEGRNGNTLLHCFGGCTTEAVCDSLALSLADLFSEPGAARPKPRVVREAEKQIADLRSRLTARERILPVTIIYADSDHVDEGIAWALALAVEGEIVQVVPEGRQ
jgi:hypothetical protein